MVNVKIDSAYITCEDEVKAEQLVDKLDELFSEFAIDGKSYYFDFIMEE